MANHIRERRKAQGLTLEALAERAELSRSYLSRLESGERPLGLEAAARIAVALGVEVADLTDEEMVGAKEATAHLAEGKPLFTLDGPPDVVRADVEVPLRSTMPRDLPVYGTAMGSVINNSVEGFDLLVGEAIDYVRRPPALSRARDAYAIYVSGDSMEPAHPHGELRMVNPGRPPQPGDTVIVVTRNWNDYPDQAYIKIYRRRAGGDYVLEQLNPPAEIRVPETYVVSLHRVLTLSELFGV